MTSPAARGPVLVTGIPRSGTTWLARLLAQARGTSMLGREPMNPRDGQYALAGEARAWTRWTDPPPRAGRLLRATYAGRAPRAYGRLGIGQWRAPLPGTRVIVKDPFALLSVAAVARTTGATPVVVYRSPGAVLASYRRMGWRADIGEFRALGAPVPPGADDDDAVAMAAFWSWGYDMVLHDLERFVPAGLVVSHEELTRGGPAAQRVLFSALGLDGSRISAVGPDTGERAEVRPNRLHNFDRSPDEVTSGWQARITEDEGRLLAHGTAATEARLGDRRLRLT